MIGWSGSVALATAKGFGSVAVRRDLCAARMEETVWAAERNDYWRASAEHSSACFNVSNQIQFAAFCGVDGLYICVTVAES